MTVTLPTSRSIAMHEAHHAAALCLAGMVPKGVRIDWPTAELAGFVTVDWGDGADHDKAKRVLVAVLLGAMTEGFAGWDIWPIDPDRAPLGARRDAEQARHLAGYLKLDQVGWLHVVWKANRLARRSGFRRLAVAIADELERVEAQTAEELVELIATTEEPWST
jgi:hypothetical protein